MKFLREKIKKNDNDYADIDELVKQVRSILGEIKGAQP